jgi:putative transposase
MFERLFFITTVTFGRNPLFRAQRVALLFIETMYEYRRQGKLLLHEFVLMPDHLHLLITPSTKISLERCLQFLKGGFSFRCSKELAIKRGIWQPGFENHRVRDESDYQVHRAYIHMNPVRARLAEIPSDYAYSSANPRFELDLSTAAKAAIFGATETRINPRSSTCFSTPSEEHAETNKHFLSIRSFPIFSMLPAQAEEKALCTGRRWESG